MLNFLILNGRRRVMADNGKVKLSLKRGAVDNSAVTLKNAN